VCPEKWCMIGEEYLYGKFVDKCKKSADKWNITEIIKKTMNKVDNVGMDTDRIYACCDRERVEPPDTLLAKE